MQISATNNILDNNQQLYRSIVDYSIAAIFLGCPDSGETYYANPSASKIFGYTLKEFQELNRSSIFLTDEALLNCLKERKNTGKFNGVLTAIRKNGEQFPCEVSSVLFTDTDGRLKASTTLIDISERKKAEEALQISNERYKLATQATADIIWDWDMATNEVAWAPNFTLILGHPLPPDSKLSVQFCIDNFHPEDRKRVTDSLDNAINDPTKTKWENEFLYLRADGSYAFVKDRGYILRNSDGKAVRMIGAIQDISKSKYHEQLLALELYTYEISSTPGVPFKQVVSTLLQGIENIHTDMISSVLLLKDDDTITQLSSPRLPEEYTRLIEGLKIGPAIGSCGTAMFRKEPVIVADIDSDPLWADYKEIAAKFNLKACWSVPIINSNGKVMCSFAIYYNESKHPTELEWNTINKIRNLLRILVENHFAIEEIRLSNERFNIVSDATHDMLWDWNLETGSIYREAAGLQEVYGIKDNDSIIRVETWLDRVHPDDRRKVYSVISDIRNAGDRDTFDMEYRFQRTDGTYSHVFDRGMLIRDETGKPYRMIGAAQNITDRKMLEQELLQQEIRRQKEISQAIIDTQEKERADIGKELHDNVNQVLTTTKLYLDLASSDPLKQPEFINKCSENILYVINEIRKLSRSLMLPSLGDLGLLESITDLTESINFTQKFHIDFIAEPEIEDSLSDNQKLIIYRIIQETVNNIIQHAEARSVLINLNISDDFLQLIVSDDGKGFDQLTIKRGAGLRNIENRVYLFNGSLETNTSPGKGCELVINIPLRKYSSG